MCIFSFLFLSSCPRFVNVLVYYGLSLGVSRLGANLYMTQFVFGLVEIPARSLVLLVLPCSRRFSQSGFLAVGGLACLLMLTVPAGKFRFWDPFSTSLFTDIYLQIFFRRSS